MKDIPQEFKVALEARFQTEPWAWLLETTIPTSPVTVVRLCNQPKEIQFDIDAQGIANTFLPSGFGFGAIIQDSEGNLPSLPLTLAGVSREILAVLLNHDFLIKQRVRLILVNAATLDNSAAKFDFNLEVSSATIQNDKITFRLSSYSLHKINAPRRRMNRSICDHAYGDPNCGFDIDANDPGLALLGPCTKSESACELRGARELALGLPVLHPERIGLFKGMPLGGQ